MKNYFLEFSIRAFKKSNLIYLFILFGIIESNFINSANIKSANPDLTVMSLNTYTFPADLVGLLKGLNITDLASGITKSIPQRIKEIGPVVDSLNPDIALFQELWNNKNKEEMIAALGKKYPYTFYFNITDETEKADLEKSIKNFFSTAVTKKNITLEDLAQLNPLKLDSGLLIASQLPILWKKSIEYPEKMDEEILARKGALIVGLKDRNNKPTIVATTHLQSGTGLEYIKIKEDQMKFLGSEIKKIQAQQPGFENAKIIIAGDLNEPIDYQKSNNRLVDRTRYLVQALNDQGVNVSNAQVIKIISDILGTNELLEVNELKKEGILKTDKGTTKLDPNDPLLQRLNLSLFNYFAEASEPSGTQLLDHFFVEDGTNISNYRVLRKQFLGDNGPNTPYNGTIALSDHAGIIADFSSKKD